MWKHTGTALLVVLAALAAVVWRSAGAQAPLLEVHVLDVGQGDAVLIELPDTTQILIDGGPDALVLSELADVMGPLDTHLDVVLSTHPDKDHIGGLLDVLERYDVSTIVLSGIEKETALYQEWIAAVAAERAHIIFADGMKRLRFGDIAVLDLLWPQQSQVGRMPGSVNEYSVVTRLTYGSVDMLFTGDIELWTENRLRSSGVLTDIDVLKVPHHGSKTSTTHGLLQETMPEIAVISVGKENRYGHPDEGVLSRLHTFHAAIYRTDTMGRMTLSSDGSRVWVD